MGSSPRLRHVAQIRVQRHALRDLGDEQVRGEGVEGRADVRLLAQRRKAREELADAAVVDVAVPPFRVFI